MFVIWRYLDSVWGHMMEVNASDENYAKGNNSWVIGVHRRALFDIWSKYWLWWNCDYKIGEGVSEHTNYFTLILKNSVLKNSQALVPCHHCPLLSLTLFSLNLFSFWFSFRYRGIFTSLFSLSFANLCPCGLLYSYLFNVPVYFPSQWILVLLIK